jgi:hypothetical protein
MLSRVLFCLLASVLAAQEQTARRPPGWPCASGRAVDPSYAAVAEGSGGHLYMLDPSEIAQTGTLMAWHQKHTETIFRAMGEVTEGPREFAFPIDSTIESLVITVSLQCRAGVSILAAGGIDAAGERIDFMAGRALRVALPAPGVWKIKMAGRGLYFVTVEAVTELSLDDVVFVEPGGRPGHEGLFRVKTPPAIGTRALMQVELSKAPETIQLRLVDSAARTLETPAVQTLPPDTFLSSLTLRHSGFRVAVDGIDERGWPFLRMHAPLTVVR